MKHGNVAVFVPHAGCPNECSFCNQKAITSVNSAPSAQDVVNTVNNALAVCENDTANMEIAFFGGSFTAVDRDYMVSLLQAAYPYVKDKRFKGIRISTRPDAIDGEVLKILKEYGVTSIELGAQSMIDSVLLANRRGHTAQDVINSSAMIKEASFSLGLQMMTGLYTSDDEKDLRSAEKIIALAPDTVRIYPTVVLKNTHLAQLLECGEYVPQTLECTVNLCARLITMFENANINVIRVGLHAGEDVKKNFLAGGYHCALRELAESRIMLQKAIKALEGIPFGNVTFVIRSADRSRFTGQKRKNIDCLKAMGYNITVKEDNSLLKYELRLENGT